MNQLDNLKLIKEIDPERTLDSIKAFPLQIKQSWETVKSINISENYLHLENIVACGMGGSALSARIVKNLYDDELLLPLEIVTEYSLPEYVNEKTLVVLISYSGNTEETLSCLSLAKERKARVFAITSGGKLKDEIKNGLPGVIFNPKDNYLGFPKTGVGYTFGTLLAFLAKIKMINLSQSDFEKSFDDFLTVVKFFWPEELSATNPAKQIAQLSQGKLVAVTSSEHLKGSAWAFKNQINEIAHIFAVSFDLPEMNHHLVESFEDPVAAKNLIYLFLSSKYYQKKNQVRIKITQEILKKLKVTFFNYNLKSKYKLGQAIEAVQLGGFISDYLSVLNNKDPAPEPWIIYLKKKLSAYEK